MWEIKTINKLWTCQPSVIFCVRPPAARQPQLKKHWPPTRRENRVRFLRRLDSGKNTGNLLVTRTSVSNLDFQRVSSFPPSAIWEEQRKLGSDLISADALSNLGHMIWLSFLFQFLTLELAAFCSACLPWATLWFTDYITTAPLNAALL